MKSFDFYKDEVLEDIRIGETIKVKAFLFKPIFKSSEKNKEVAFIFKGLYQQILVVDATKIFEQKDMSSFEKGLKAMHLYILEPFFVEAKVEKINYDNKMIIAKAIEFGLVKDEWNKSDRLH